MSATRWARETLCKHGRVDRHVFPPAYGGRDTCPGGTRLVVDPDNLPPEAIERAAIASWVHDGALSWESWEVMPERVRVRWRAKAEAAIRAFFSDPEQDFQPTESTEGKDQPTT